MSLRGRIILLFVGLAILPLLGVAAFGARQAEGLVGQVMMGVLSGSASRLSSELDQALVRVENRLDDLASGVHDDSLTTMPGELAGWATELGLPPDALAYVQILRSGTVIRSWGSVPDEATRCRSDRLATLSELSRPPQGADRLSIRAGVWPDGLGLPSMEDRSRTYTVFDANSGTVVLASPCQSNAHALLAAADGGPSADDSGFADRFASFQPLADRPWVAATSMARAAVLDPLDQIQRSYWLFVLLLTLSTALAFSVLLRELVRSLERLTEAAERIGDGDLDPWLPPPGNDEVGRLSMAFAQMLERLRQMIQRVDQEGRLAVVGRLTSYLAHEIRNPLSSIRMNLQVLDRDLRHGRVPEDSRELMELSLREVDRLASSVNQVLRLGANSGGQRVEVSVLGIVEEAVQLMAEQCREAGVDINVELDPAADRVLAVPGQFKGVLMNLLVNAVEAQPEGGAIVISSRLAVSGDGRPNVAIHVRDTGSGIPPRLRDRIFQPFFTTKGNGSGIGLAAAQRTMRDGGGDLYLAELPETESGAEFVVEVPLAAVASEQVSTSRVYLPQWMTVGPDRSIAGRTVSRPEPQRGLS